MQLYIYIYKDIYIHTYMYEYTYIAASIITWYLKSHSVTLSWHWANQSLPYPNNAKHLARKWQVYIFKSSVWLDQCSNMWVWMLRSSKTGDGPSSHSTFLSGRRERYWQGYASYILRLNQSGIECGTCCTRSVRLTHTAIPSCLVQSLL